MNGKILALTVARLHADNHPDITVEQVRDFINAYEKANPIMKRVMTLAATDSDIAMRYLDAKREMDVQQAQAWADVSWFEIVWAILICVLFITGVVAIVAPVVMAEFGGG